MSDAHASHDAKHPYHLVDPSPWPIVGAIAAGVLTVGAVLYMHGKAGGMIVLPLGVLGVLGDHVRLVARRGAARRRSRAITRRWCRSACATAWRCSSPPR